MKHHPNILIMVPLLSSTPDGTITAGFGVRRLCSGLNQEYHPLIATTWDNLFLWVNDHITWRWPRWVVRFFFLHFVALFEQGRPKIFTSHHSPFFESGHIVIIHDVIPFYMPDRYPAQTFYTKFFLSSVMSSADVVVTISEVIKKALLQLFPEVRSKLVVIPSYSNKIDVKCFNFHSTGHRQKGRFLMVGMTRRHKNLNWGAAGVEAAANLLPGLRLDAVGVWPEFWPDVYEAAAATERRSLLFLHKYVDDATLDDFYSSAQALLYLSTDEGMGLPPLEALARGCPVVCSDIPILREVCGEAAFYVRLGDTAALANLLVQLSSGELDHEIDRKLLVGQSRLAYYGAVPLAAKWGALLQSYAHWRVPVVI
jgi:glycosyltransferase involved in cell wall biosynthesis